MSKSPNEIAARVIAQLAQTAPGLSCERGTVTRKIIDACSEAVAEAYVDQYLVGSILDIDTKVGLELEQFVGLWGVGRLQGRAAVGVVRVTLNTASTQDYQIPLGTQFYTKSVITGTNNQLFFSSTQAMVLVAGTVSIDVPIQCASVGTVGNVAPDTITFLASAIGSGSATNLNSMTGGVDVETDSELRQRFKDTLLRNMAGSSDFYKALCLQNNHVSRVAVFGPTTLYRTQIEAPSVTLPLSLSQDVKYTWAGQHSVFANIGQENEVFYSPIYDYALSSGASPVFTRNDAGDIAAGDIVDLEFQYVTKSSRNDPVAGITNKVDVFVDGINPVSVTEKTVITSAALSSNSADDYWVGRFERVGSAGTPSAGNRFMRLGSVPVVTFPSTISVGNTVYSQGVHYHLLRDISTMAGGHQETSGIEWDPSGPSDTTSLVLTYIYNEVPEVLSHVLSAAKQITTDVMVHQAKFVYLRPCLSVCYDRSYSVSTTNTAIDERLKSFFAAMTYGAHVRFSVLAMAVQQVMGVVDVTITTATDSPTAFGIEAYHNSSDPDPSTIHDVDFKLADNELPIFMETVILRKAAD